jgi:hypothetical protein
MKSAFRCLAVLLLALSGWLQPCVIDVQQPSPQRADEPKAQTVYVTRTGKRYHRDVCRYLSMSKIRMTLKDAKAQGYTPCKVCRPPQ